jgi:hypothetical protein
VTCARSLRPPTAQRQLPSPHVGVLATPCVHPRFPDSYTEAGTWVSYTGPKSLTKISDYASSKGLAGVFVFDTSQVLDLT